MAHPKHPPCPGCGKSLFKSFAPRAVKKTDPWDFCRNTKGGCGLAGPDGMTTANKALAKSARPEVAERFESKTAKVSVLVPPPEEPEEERRALFERRLNKYRKQALKRQEDAKDATRFLDEAEALGQKWFDESSAKIKKRAAKQLVEAAEDAEEHGMADRALAPESQEETPPNSSSKRRRARAAPEEPEEIRAARERLRPLVEKIAPPGAPPVAVGLVLAILNQETGSKAAANLLIDEFDLTKLFGIQKH